MDTTYIEHKKQIHHDTAKPLPIFVRGVYNVEPIFDWKAKTLKKYNWNVQKYFKKVEKQ